MADTTHPTIRVINVEELEPHVDIALGFPLTKDLEGGKMGYHRVPIRCRTDTDCPPVCKNTAGLRRLALRFENVWVPHIRAYGDEGASLNPDPGAVVRMCIALGGKKRPDAVARMCMALTGNKKFDNVGDCTGTIAIERLDEATRWIRKHMVLQPEIRQALGIAMGCKKEMTEETAEVYAETLDTVNIVKPSTTNPWVKEAGEEEEEEEEEGEQEGVETRGEGGLSPSAPVRYIYPKVAATGYYRSLLRTPSGGTITVAEARAWGNRGCRADVVLVELESIFSNKLIRSIQLRVLEAIITPPAAGIPRRSLLHPDEPPVPLIEHEDYYNRNNNNKRKHSETE